MKNKHILLLGASVLLTLGVISPSFVSKKEEDAFDYVYEEPVALDADQYLRAVPDDDVVCPTKVIIHYHNDDGKNDTRLFYTWTAGVNGVERKPTFLSDDKKDMYLTLDFTVNTEYAGKESMYFIIKYVGTWAGQSEDTLIDYAKWTPDANGLLELWTIPGEGIGIDIYRTEEETKLDKIQTAKFTSWKNIHCVASAVPTSYKIYAFDQTYLNMEVVEQERDKENYLFKTGQPSTAEFDIQLNKLPHLNVLYMIESWYASKPGVTQKTYVTPEYLYEDSRFEKLFTYSGNDLGVTYTKEKTTFKVWAPTCGNVLLKIYKTGTPKALGGTAFAYVYRMVYQEGGIWTITLNGDYNGKYYNYLVTNTLGTNEVVDPYAKACGVSGLRGMILDFDTTDPEGWDELSGSWENKAGLSINTPQDLTIYEAHIRDLTMDETWNGQEPRGTYKAFVEDGTTYTKGETTVTTGFAHMKEMGFNAIQLTPVFDNDNDETFKYNEAGEVVGSNVAYNWGYNPLNYNCVEGGYSTDPYNGEVRVKEFKELIQAFANTENHTRVIMDVVYNHVASAANSCFTKIMPKYYFRYDADWNYYNGSGCGNEVKTEAKMMRKYIVDSLLWWAQEYNIKGFRFDLMGLIDTKTMKAAKEALYAYDPTIYLYGEGWTGDGQAAHTSAKSRTHGANTYYTYNELYDSSSSHGYVGAFNDAGRNALKGGNDHGDGMKGFIDSGYSANAVADMLVGYHSGSGANRYDPKQDVSYASCHDNYTLFDQLTYTVGNDGNNSYYPANTCAAVAAVECAVLFTNGVAFIQGGEEVFRSKVITSDADKELIKQVGEDGSVSYKDTATIAGKMVSHNSYNLSDAVNAYKWDRKISIGSTNTLQYVRAIQAAIQLRKHLARYSKADMDAHGPYEGTGTFFAKSTGSDWGTNAFIIRNGAYYFIIAGNRSDNIAFSEYESGINQLVYCSNPDGGFSHPSTGNIKLGWSTSVVLTDSAHTF